MSTTTARKPSAKKSAAPAITPAQRRAANATSAAKKTTARKRPSKPAPAKPTAPAVDLEPVVLEGYVKRALTTAGVKQEDLTAEQLERAFTSPVKHGGLRGKALALFIIEGQELATQIANGRAATATAKAGAPIKDTIGVDAGPMLRDYLEQEASVLPTAPNDEKPWVTEDGRVYVHSSQLIAYLERVHKGKTIEKRAVTSALKSLGLTVRAYPIPGEGRSLGYWQGKVDAKLVDGIGRRESIKSAGPGARIPDDATVRLAITGDDVRAGLSTWLRKARTGDVTISAQDRDGNVLASITVQQDGSVVATAV